MMMIYISESTPSQELVGKDSNKTKGLNYEGPGELFIRIIDKVRDRLGLTVTPLDLVIALSIYY